MGLGRPLRWLVVAAASWAALSGRPAAAEPAVDEALPEPSPPALAEPLLGRRIVRIEVVTAGGRWQRAVALRRTRVGDALSGEAARRALDELADSGRYADVRAEAIPSGDGALLRLVVVPRRIVSSVRILGGSLPDDEAMRALALDVADEITAESLGAAAERLRAFYAERGYERVVVAPDAIDTDDEMRVVVVLRVSEGPPRVVGSRVIRIYPAPGERLKGILGDYAVGPGDRADEDALGRADRELEDALRRAGWHVAEVNHRTRGMPDGAALMVDVQAGPYVQVTFEGNRLFDEAELTDALDLEGNEDRAPAALASRVEKLYVDRGFFDVRVVPRLEGRPTDVQNRLVFRIHEGGLVRVVGREYPCLTGDRGADDVGLEIDSFLSEALPGASIAGPVDPGAVDAALGPRGNTGARPRPLQTNPWLTYVPEVYERATRHLQELYRSEGYLSATVGPVVLMRRACDPRSPPGRCAPLGERVRPRVECPTGAEVPVAEDGQTSPCTPDPQRGVRCEPDVVLHIPVKLGPRAVLWDATFEGNQTMVEAELAEIAEVDLGEPMSQVALDEARRRVLDEYAERGFAFATVELRVELSPDRTRARARFIVTEREQVRVKDIVVRGARRTNESLVLGRVALSKGDVYRRSEVRATEERLATLGVFSSVAVALEDPEVFAREKVVVVTVRERAPQYTDLLLGFSTGDGIRVTFEYGHRNLGGEAVRFTLRAQLGLLPDFLILEDDVRARFQALPLGERLERRNSASVEFPEIGLGPLFPFGVDGVDVRDNSRDFGLTKDAGIVTLSYRPTTRFVTQIGASLERNVATIFASDTSLEAYIAENPGSAARLRVPEGTTVAVAERTGVTWDRRDDPFNATRGTFVSGSLEHVHAEPEDETEKTPTSDFLRATGRVGGYLRLTGRGLALAMSLRWGQNVQLIDGSKTYPDRLFFFGGVDSIRGFLQDSVIPQDIAEEILADAQNPALAGDERLTADKIVIRGGDLVLNPRLELRVPLGGVFQTALFVDSGNVWLDPARVEPWVLRYAAGSGLRATTPVGPLALDLGFNLDRRDWEDPFAFHFSIGLF